MGKTFYINFYDAIEIPKVNALMAICTDIVHRENPDTLYFLFSSSGGSVDAGMVLYNFLKSLPVEVVMHNTGSIDSIATVVFLAGNKRYAARHSAFLVHGIQWNFHQPTSLTIPQLREHVSRAKNDESKIISIYSEHTSLEKEEIISLFNEGESKGLEFAMDTGFISEIKDSAIPKGAPFFSVNLQ